MLLANKLLCSALISPWKKYSKPAGMVYSTHLTSGIFTSMQTSTGWWDCWTITIKRETLSYGTQGNVGYIFDMSTTLHNLSCHIGQYNIWWQIDNDGSWNIIPMILFVCDLLWSMSCIMILLNDIHLIFYGDAMYHCIIQVILYQGRWIDATSVSYSISRRYASRN